MFHLHGEIEHKNKDLSNSLFVLNMYLVKTPEFIQTFFPDYIWTGSSEEKVLYLSFDDGPIPEITPWVLKQLAQYEAKATFFCVGENVKKHPSIFETLIESGHSIGNHTFNHLSGWSSDNADYIDNVQQCAEVVTSKLFRPPYGRLKPKQAQQLKQDYRIVMWDILSGDFDPKISSDQCYKNVIKNAGPGSIIVFHDSKKAEEKLKYVLPRVLKYFSQQGYRFEQILEPSKVELATSS